MMARVEYRIERIPLNGDEPRLPQLVERLAELGRQGWHVASVDLTPHPSFERGNIRALVACLVPRVVHHVGHDPLGVQDKCPPVRLARILVPDSVELRNGAHRPAVGEEPAAVAARRSRQAGRRSAA